MTTTSNTDLQQLKEFISDRFNQLDGKIEKLTDKVDDLSEKVNSLDKRLAVVESKVDSTEKRFNTVEAKLPDISEKFGELKNWRQIAFIIIAAVVGWFARSGRM
jgi:archaellum component FlaC